jgi:glycosyltransferase involved in cell wall biosynthesis
VRIVFLTETFGPRLGYIANCLPPALARLGAEVHVVSLDLLPYYYLRDHAQTYGAFYADEALQPGVTAAEGYTLHVLPHRRQLGYVRAAGLAATLRALAPDIVQTAAAIGWLPLDAAVLQPRLGFKLFTGNHNTISTFHLLTQRRPSPLDPAWVQSFLTRAIPGRLIGLVTEKCYGVTVDCAEIAWRFYGVPRAKVEVMHLGVDTAVFHPDGDAAERETLRTELGVAPDDILCVYTGKLNQEKDALILARAVAHLRAAGAPYAGLFIGEGVQRAAIAATPGCTVLPFMPYQALGRYYRAADIGVWPTNESTSMLDAAACGLPLVISDVVTYRDHVDGNGLVARIHDLADLERCLLELKDPAARRRLGAHGAAKMARDFSWDVIARRRMDDYAAALAKGGRR